MTTDPGMPRQQHYLFAHKILPQIVYQNPQKALGLLTSTEARPLLLRLWERLGEDLPEKERLPAMGLGCHSRVLEDGRIVVVVRMPPPERMTEAHFVGFLFTPGEKMLFFFQKPPTASCFTLEHSFQLDGTPRTVLGGWTPEGAHFNMGDGPPADLNNFVATLLSLKRKDQH